MHTTLTADSQSFYRTLARLAIPIVLQNLVTTAVSSADVIMLGFVSRLPCQPDHVYFKSGIRRYFLWNRHAGGTVLGQTGYAYH